MKNTDSAGKKIADLVLDPKDAERVKKRYQERIAKYGVTMASLCVGDEEKQLVYTSGWDTKSYYRYNADGGLFDNVIARYISV